MAKRIKAILIDPFKQELWPVLTDSGPHDIAKLLDCEYIEGVNLQMTEGGARQLWAWVDEEGLLRTPFVYPHWAIAPDPHRPAVNGGRSLAGYGLITGIGKAGEILCCHAPITFFANVILFEPWRSRLDMDAVIPQMLRIYPVAKITP